MLVVALWCRAKLTRHFSKNALTCLILRCVLWRSVIKIAVRPNTVFVTIQQDGWIHDTGMLGIYLPKKSTTKESAISVHVSVVFFCLVAGLDLKKIFVSFSQTKCFCSTCSNCSVYQWLDIQFQTLEWHALFCSQIANVNIWHGINPSCIVGRLSGTLQKLRLTVVN